MRLEPEDARARFVDARVARLATVTAEGRPHVVPVCFAVIGDTVYSAVDDKPKTSPDLRRLDNVRVHHAASLLVDHYDDRDWARLWWVRADGAGRAVHDDDERARAIDRLRERYAQYEEHALTDAVLAVDVTRWTGWAASDTRPAPGR